jgi:hypothetical protein
MSFEITCLPIKETIVTHEKRIAWCWGGKMCCMYEISVPTVKMEVFTLDGDQDHIIVRCPCSNGCKCAIYDYKRVLGENNLIAYAKSLTPNNKLSICSCTFDIKEQEYCISNQQIKCSHCSSEYVESKIENKNCIITCQKCFKITNI